MLSTSSNLRHQILWKLVTVENYTYIAVHSFLCIKWKYGNLAVKKVLLSVSKIER